MNRKPIFWLKLALTLAVIGFIGWEIYKDAGDLRKQRFTLDGWYLAGSLAAFGAFMIQSALVWCWLIRQMGDATPLPRAMGAYVYSQMGKYVPGKVALLLMRITRADRVGIDGQTVVVATLVENAMYMISGAIIAAGTLLLYARDNWLLAAGLGAGILAMCAVFYPAIFYALVNRVLRKMKRPEVTERQRLRGGHMLVAVIGFFPCWLLGGLSLWCATRGIQMASPEIAPPTITDYAKFPGTVALGVVGGMAFLTPGGVGPRELIMGIFLVPMVGRPWALLAVALQRLVQITCEVMLGVIGALATRRETKPAERQQAAER